MSPAEQERTVQVLLEAAAVLPDDHGIETFVNPSLSAYRSLAKSRGVDLEVVIRLI